MLSQAERFQRKWPSLYEAVEDARLDEAWLSKFLAQQVPQRTSACLPWMVRPGPRPRAKTIHDRQYVYQASNDVNGGTIAIGYSYSSLDWIVEPHSGWALLVNEQRVASHQTP